MLDFLTRFMVKRLPPPGKAHADVIEDLRSQSTLPAEQFDAKVPLLERVPLERLHDLASLAPHCAAHYIDGAVNLMVPRGLLTPLFLLTYMVHIATYRVGAVLWRVAVFDYNTDSFRVQFDRLMLGLGLWGLYIIAMVAGFKWAQTASGPACIPMGRGEFALPAALSIMVHYVREPLIWLAMALFYIKTILRDPEADSWGPLSGKFEDHIEGVRAATWMLVSAL